MLHVVARWSTRDADQSCAQRAQKPHQIRITGIVDQHHIARLYEAARRQFQTLARAMREQHLIAAGGDELVLREVLRNRLAQREQAHGFAVAAQRKAFGAQFAHAAPHAVGKHPVVGQPAAAGFERPVAVLEDLLQIPVCIEHGRKALVARLVLRPDADAIDEEARVRLIAQQPLRDEAVVGLDHGEHAHRMRG